ncbi:MAG TPA: hypothetical protein VGX52_08265 [Burkholderiales bacterium]|nr:hypothetical protein [Burkholderiales bacterium]
MSRAAPFLLLVLCGCAVDCTNSNWQERGYRDGYGGHPPQDMVLARQCVDISQADYLKGWVAGNDEHVRLKTMNCD